MKSTEHINIIFVHLKAKYKLVSAQSKVYISYHHADCSMRLRVKHQKPNFQLRETIRFGAAGHEIRLRHTTFAKNSFQFWLLS